MKLEDRIILFSELGKHLSENLETEEFESILNSAKSKNAWFTLDNLKKSISSIVENYLTESKLQDFCSSYYPSFFNPSSSKKVGIIAAGNIPLVGFQDIVHVILSGNTALYKPSSQDEILILYFLKILKSIDSRIENYFVIADRLNDADAFIATGSGNTSRYFEYYFANKPHLIRRNRSSVAVLSGNETKIELADLALDIFSYFGLGCRNVAKLFVPKDYDFTYFFESIEYWNSISMHSKYNNNYDYMKSIYLVNREKHLDNGFLLLKEDGAFASPISVLYFEQYENVDQVNSRLNDNKENIQVIISHIPEITGAYSFGKSQEPSLSDFADNIDTIDFLKNINA